MVASDKMPASRLVLWRLSIRLDKPVEFLFRTHVGHRTAYYSVKHFCKYEYSIISLAMKGAASTH